MKYTRIRIKNTKAIINVISATSAELVALSSGMSVVGNGIAKMTLLVEGNTENRTIIINDEFFNQNSPRSYFATKDRLNVDFQKFINTHMDRWNIATQDVPKRKADPKKYTKIDID